jgi:hypothetical protein
LQISFETGEESIWVLVNGVASYFDARGKSSQWATLRNNYELKVKIIYLISFYLVPKFKMYWEQKVINFFILNINHSVPCTLPSGRPQHLPPSSAKLIG